MHTTKNGRGGGGELSYICYTFSSLLHYFILEILNVKFEEKKNETKKKKPFVECFATCSICDRIVEVAPQQPRSRV
jgi:hypothetical protein